MKKKATRKRRRRSRARGALERFASPTWGDLAFEEAINMLGVTDKGQVGINSEGMLRSLAFQLADMLNVGAPNVDTVLRVRSTRPVTRPAEPETPPASERRARGGSSS